jgi:hypothetical protein
MVDISLPRKYNIKEIDEGGRLIIQLVKPAASSWLLHFVCQVHISAAIGLLFFQVCVGADRSLL